MTKNFFLLVAPIFYLSVSYPSFAMDEKDEYGVSKKLRVLANEYKDKYIGNIFYNRSKELVKNVTICIHNTNEESSFIAGENIEPGKSVVYVHPKGFVATKVDAIVTANRSGEEKKVQLLSLTSTQAIKHSKFLFMGSERHEKMKNTNLPTYRLVLNDLRCLKTEDNGGPDECRLDIWADNAHYAYNNDLNNGDTWNLGLNILFKKKVRIRLTDLDNPGFPFYDDHDYLGEIEIKPQQVEEGKTTFDRDDAIYELSWTERVL